MKTHRRFLMLGVAFFAAVIGAAVGTTVVPMDVAALADHAAVVIEGSVSSVESYWAESPRRIESVVRFTEIRFLKGGSPARASGFELIVPGGCVGDVCFRIAGAPQFAPRQRRILFVQSSYRTHPIVGIFEGSFPIIADERGVSRVHREGGAAVIGVTGTGQLQEAPRRANGSLSRSALRGGDGVQVVKVPAASGSAQAMPLDDFIERIQPILDASRTHSGPPLLPTRVQPTYTPVSLQRADVTSLRKAASPSRSGYHAD